MKKLGDLVEFKTNNSLSREKLNYEKGSVKNIHYGDIHKNFQTLFYLNNEVVPYINTNISLERISEESYCKEGDVIFADASEDLNDVGKSIEIVNLNDEKVLSGLHTILARPKDGYFSKGFLGYVLKSENLRYQIQKESQGTKVLSISAKRLSKVRVNYPSVKEQEKIADFFFQLDKRIETQRESSEYLESLIKGYRQKLFSQELRFKDENGNDFPDWEERRLKQICEVAKSGGTPTSTINEYYNGNIPFLSISDMTNQGKYIRITSKTISQKGLDNSSSWLVPTNSIIYSMYASVGYVSINKIPIATSQAVINLILKGDTNIDYVYYFLSYFKTYIHKYIETGTQGNLNAQIVKNFKISIPILKEQEKIANFLSKLDEKLANEKDLLNEYEMQKKYFLQNMFV